MEIIISDVNVCFLRLKNRELIFSASISMPICYWIGYRFYCCIGYYSIDTGMDQDPAIIIMAIIPHR